jgi:hypothetical protein
MQQPPTYRVLRDGKSTRPYSESELMSLALVGKVRPLDLICLADSGARIGLARDQAWFARAFSMQADPSTPPAPPAPAAARIVAPAGLAAQLRGDSAPRPPDLSPLPLLPLEDAPPSPPRRVISPRLDADTPPRLASTRRSGLLVAIIAALAIAVVALPVGFSVYREMPAGAYTSGPSDYERGVEALNEARRIVLMSKDLPQIERRKKVLEAERILNDLKSNPAYDQIAAIPGAMKIENSSALGELAMAIGMAKMLTKDADKGTVAIDDNPARTLSECLERNGLEFIEADDGKLAISMPKLQSGDSLGAIFHHAIGEPVELLVHVSVAIRRVDGRIRLGEVKLLDVVISPPEALYTRYQADRAMNALFKAIDTIQNDPGFAQCD